MSLMNRVSKWMSNLRHRKRSDRELDQEVGSYVQLLTEEKIRGGMEPSAAHRAALIELEGMQQVKEKVREARTGAWLDQFAQDVRYGLRLLRKNPGFTAIAVLTVALGMGANTAIFSVLYSVLLKPLPYSNPKQVIRIWQAARTIGFDQLGMNEGQFVRLREEKQSLGELGVYRFGVAFIGRNNESERVFSALASSGVLEALGVKPILGRGFSRDDEIAGGARVTILSNQLWQRWFNGDPNIIGQTLHIDEKPVTIIGVLPADFFLPEDYVGSETIQLWLPLKINSANPRWDSFNFQPVARLKNGHKRETAEVEVRTLFERLYPEHPLGVNTLKDIGWSLTAVPVQDDLVGDVRIPLLVLAGAVAVVLLIVCANVASLLLARAAARQSEITVRVALGASRGRIVRQLLTESLIISSLGSAVGLLLATWGVRSIVRIGGHNVPRLDQAALNLPVLLFALAACVISACIFGLAPAIQTVRTDLNQSLRAQGRNGSDGVSKTWTQRILVVGEVSLAMVLVISAGLLLRGYSKLVRIDPGFNPNGVWTAEIDLPDARYSENARVVAFSEEMLRRVQALPGVLSAAVTSAPPLVGSSGDTAFDIESRPAETKITQHVYLWQVTSDYFKTIGAPILRGRTFQETDGPANQPVVVINESLAKHYWPDSNPVGQRIRFYLGIDKRSIWIEIAGVVKNVAARQLNENPLPSAYILMPQSGKIFPVDWGFANNLVVRTSSQPLLLTGAIRAQVKEMDPGVAIRRIRTADQLVEQAVAQPHFNLVLLGLFAGLALTLAAVGIYGILANMVRQRTREIGIRLALGAQRGDVFRLVVGQGMRLAGLGLLIGLAGALGATRLLTNLLFGVKPTDPLTFAAVVVLLSSVAMLACYIPARRAMRVDPMVTLRYE
ncbi:MAG TPA: ABC transporter permease [Alphaproteobacteria bacterium]|nr:ABC transporter permease [Alphaproteobacteria bacterium]